MDFENLTKVQMIDEIKHLRAKIEELEDTKIDLTSSMSVKMHTSKLIDSILNTLSESALILNEESLITNYNVVAKQIICMNFDKIFGRNITDFFPMDSQKFINSKINKIMTSGLPGHFEEERKGRIFDITIYPISVINNKIDRLAFFARDITERKKIEESEYRKSLQLEQLLKTAHDITSNLSMKEILERISKAAKEILHAYGCTIYLFDEKKGELVPQVVIDPIYHDEILSTRLSVDNSFTGMAIKEKRSLLFNNTLQEKGGYQVPGTSVLQNERIIVTPFIIEEKAIGAMTLNKIGQIFTEEDLSLAETFGIYIAATIKNARLLQELENEIIVRKQAEKNIETHKEHLKLINRILRHDIINDLTKISSAIRVFNRTNNANVLNEAQDAVNSSARIIEKMKSLESYFTHKNGIQLYTLSDILDVTSKHFSEIDVKIEGDADILANESIFSVFENLFRNAIQHGKANKILIKIINHSDMVNVYFADNGTGVPDSIKSKIFEEGFTQGKSGNTGLGLYIAKKSIESFDGSIKVEDNKPKGALFILTFRSM